MPDWKPQIRTQLSSLKLEPARELEIIEEISQHLDDRYQEFLNAGTSKEKAKCMVLAELSSSNLFTQELRSTERQIRRESAVLGIEKGNFMENLFQDLRYAGRMLRKNPGFTAVAVLSLCLGIAANTTIFSFVNALLLRPAAVEEPETLWQIWQFRPNAQSELKRYGVWSRVAISHLRTQTQSCVDLAGFDSEPTLATWNRNGVGESVQCLFISGNFFDLCGIQPSLGRFFVSEEGRVPGAHPVVVVSHNFWRNRLGNDPRALGTTVTINGVALTVIGVTPKSFTGVMAGVLPDLWTPFMMAPSILRSPEWLTSLNSHSVIGLGRLKPGVSAAQAQSELTTLMRQFDAETRPDLVRGDSVVLTPSLLVPSPLRGYVRAFTALLMGAVFLVLLIACANAANLQLARAVTRRQEMAVRAALGAARQRLLRQLLTESVLLAFLGGALGLLLSAWLARLISKLIPDSLPVRFFAEFDWRVLAFTAAVSLMTGIIFGIAPAFRASRLNLVATLKDESRGLAVRRSRLANALIVGQMALCLILLLAATLCLRSLMNARSFDPGFTVKDRLTAGLSLGDFGYSPAQAKEFHARLLARVQALPGVQSAALASHLPLGTERMNGMFQIEGRESAPGEHGFFFEQFRVGPGYFATMGSVIRNGREFAETDREGARRVAIINEAASNRYWPGQNPIGRVMFAGDPTPQNALEIVGVVQTGRYRTLGEDPKPAFYECFLQGSPVNGTLVVHARGSVASTLGAIRAIAQELDPRLALTRLMTLEQHLSLALFPMRTSSFLLGVLGVVALVLAASGLFGVIAYSVSQRTREVGIRMALGANRRDVIRLILSHGMLLAGIGVVLGVIGALGATQLLRGLLFGVNAIDPIAFVAVPLTLLGIAWLACWLPARRAAKVDPIVALRYE